MVTVEGVRGEVVDKPFDGFAFAGLRLIGEFLFGLVEEGLKRVVVGEEVILDAAKNCLLTLFEGLIRSGRLRVQDKLYV